MKIVNAAEIAKAEPATVPPPEAFGAVRSFSRELGWGEATDSKTLNTDKPSSMPLPKRNS
jgi:hypothetical protein